MLRISIGICLTALTTLMMELVLIRAFDVMLTPHLAYMVITCAMFSFGVSGIYATLRPVIQEREVRKRLATLACLFAVFTVAILPVLNVLPFNHEELLAAPVVQALSFAGMYLALLIPFFLSGLIFVTVFSVYASRIRSLYAWDLGGAAVGCVVFVPFIPMIGPGGLLFCSAAFALFASGLFSVRRLWTWSSTLAGVALIALPFARSPAYFDFLTHLPKRGVQEAERNGWIELTLWDPVSKIDVIDMPANVRGRGTWTAAIDRKHVAYDGGNQSTHIYRFDGNLQALRARMDEYPDSVRRYYPERRVLFAHYLKRDSDQRVLIIGSAGGQETKAALMYGASHVDAIELVGAVVRLGTETFADYNGNIFNDPRVVARRAEGRSFIRAASEQYDIIQIFSNHTSSSIGAGSGAMSPQYLLTAEAFVEYFSHLTHNGILQINHHVYPRMVTTAALAWRTMGRSEFQKHVAVLQLDTKMDNLPTLLVKMQPWTREELNELRQFNADIAGDWPFQLLEDPTDRVQSFLSTAFYSGELPKALVASMDYRVEPATDNRPYFNFLRKKPGPLTGNAEVYLDWPTATVLNSQLRKNVIPMDLIHLIVTSVVSLFFAVIFIIVPLYFADVGRVRWKFKYASLVYFACLGAGFITVELVFIQLFMKLIGFPVYTYSTVIFTLLLSAGLGSFSSGKLGVAPDRRWSWPFVGILSTGVALLLVHAPVFDIFLATPEAVRIAVAAALIFPLGFFLGMAFPLGIVTLKDEPRGAIAWAWGVNGLFTVIGGLASVVSSMLLGYGMTLVLALMTYVIAFGVFSRMRTAAA